MADLATFIPTRQQPTGPVETFSTERAAETVEREIADRGHRHDPAALRERRPRHGRHQPAQRRAARTRSSTRSTARPRPRPGTRSSRTSCGSATANAPNEILIRNPALMGPAGAGGRRPARRPRRGLRRHVPRAVPRRSTPTSARAGRPSARAIRPSPTATTRCWSAMPWPPAPATGAGSRSTARGADRVELEDARMRLGFLTAPLPRHAAHGGRRLGGRERLREPRDRLLAAGRGAERVATRAPRTSTSPTCPRRRASEIVDEVASHGLAISGLGYYPNPMHPDREVREAAIAHQKLVIEAAAKMGVPFFNTFMGGDAVEARRRQLGDGARGLARRSSSTPRRTA